MNPELTLQNLFVEFTPVKIKKSEVGGQRKNKMDDGRPLRWEEGGKGENRSSEVGGQRSEAGKIED